VLMSCVTVRSKMRQIVELSLWGNVPQITYRSSVGRIHMLTAAFGRLSPLARRRSNSRSNPCRARRFSEDAARAFVQPPIRQTAKSNEVSGALLVSARRLRGEPALNVAVT
jgi:hypothetical protein